MFKARVSLSVRDIDWFFALSDIDRIMPSEKPIWVIPMASLARPSVATRHRNIDYHYLRGKSLQQSTCIASVSNVATR